MKSNIIAGLVGAGLASAAFLAAPAAVPRAAHAAEPDPAAGTPAVVEIRPVPAIGQYKVLSLAPFQNDTSTQRMEDAINKLAAEGWRVQTGVGITVVLSR